MGTRLERNKLLRKQRRISVLKRLCIISLIILFILGIDIVNQNIIELDCLDNPNIIKFNMESREFDLFGVTYVIDFNLLKNFLKDHFVVFLFYII